MVSYKLYVVGGYVRDKLDGKKSNDIDYCFVIDEPNHTIESGFEFMKQALIAEGFKIFLETPHMLTIRAKFPCTSKYSRFQGQTADFVLARKELGYPDDSRQPHVVPGTLSDDIFRRDFTVNALAEDLDGNIIDLCGGCKDLEARILRTPIDPNKTMLDDPLRVLRGIRFCITKDFVMCEELVNSIANPDVITKLFNVVSQDRIREELTKMFKFSTVKTIDYLVKLDKQIQLGCNPEGKDSPNFLSQLFKIIWLKPTTETK